MIFKFLSLNISSVKSRPVTLKSSTTLRRLLVRLKDTFDLRNDVHTIDYKSCNRKFVGETNILLKTSVKKHWEIKKIEESVCSSLGCV